MRFEDITRNKMTRKTEILLGGWREQKKPDFRGLILDAFKTKKS